MKNMRFVLVVAIVMTVLMPLRAQTLIDNYRFSTTVDSTMWIDITGQDTVLFATPTGYNTVNQGASSIKNIGFPFVFAGVTYTQFSATVDGAVRLGATQTGWSSSIQSSTSMPGVYGYGGTVTMDTNSYLRYAVLGDIGSRVLVVNYCMKVRDKMTYVRFQVQLYEVDGMVRIVYGPTESPSRVLATRPGLARTTNDILFINHATHSVERYTTTSLPTNAAGIWPETWRSYTFVSDSMVCPCPLTVSMLSDDPDSTVLYWADTAAAYRIRVPQLELDTVLSDTVLTLRNINSTTTYSGTIQGICGTDSSMRVRPFSFSTNCGSVHRMPWLENFSLVASGNCWLTPYQTFDYRWQYLVVSMRSGINNPPADANYSEWLISPLVELPNTIQLTLCWKYSSRKKNNVSPSVRVLLLVCDSTDAVDTNAAWVPLDTIDYTYNGTTVTFELLLDAYAGHRVRLAFHRFGIGGQFAEVDDVGIELRARPVIALEVPDKAYVDDTTVVLSQFIAGVLSNPQYEWSSTMAARGQAVILPSNDTLHIVYLAAGIDTVALRITTAYGTSTSSASYIVRDCRTVTSFPWQDDFELGIDCWKQPTNSAYVWNETAMVSHSGLTCIRATVNDADHPYDTIVSRPLAIPTNAHRMLLEWWMRCSSTGYDNKVIVLAIGENENMDDGDTLVYLSGNQDISVGWRCYRVDLGAYAGQTIRLAFLAGNSTFHIIYVDDVKVYDAIYIMGSLNTFAERAYVGDPFTAAVTLTGGDTLNLNYAWSSTMAQQGLATINGSGASVDILYSASGYDTIRVTVTNNYDTVDYTAIVLVVDCGTIHHYPWKDDFEHGLACWYHLGGWYSSSGFGHYDGAYCLRSCAHPNGTNESYWIISQPFIIPSLSDTALMELIWQMHSRNPGYTPFELRIATVSGNSMPQPGSFTTVMSENLYYGPWKRYRYNLSAYAGQTIRFMFYSTPGYYIDEFEYLLFDAVEIRSTRVPVLLLSAPMRVDHFDSVFYTAILDEGDTVGITYQWHSSLTGQSVVSGGQWMLNYSVEGIDTITVIATNAWGSDTAMAVVQVCNCPAVTAPFIPNFEDNTVMNCWSGFTCQWYRDDIECVNEYRRIGDTSTWQFSGDSANHYVSTTRRYSWLVTPAIDLPNDANGLRLSWNQLDGCYIRVAIATGDEYFDYTDFDSLVQEGNSSGPHSFPMRDYAGQRIHVGFFAYGTYGGSLDDIRISYAEIAPIAELTAPSNIGIQQAANVSASINDCPILGMAYNWHSTMAAAGRASMTIDSFTCNIIYFDEGIDTVTFIISNDYGADTQQVTIGVVDCNGYAIPYIEDFNNVFGTAWRDTNGVIPLCWNRSFIGEDCAPKVLAQGSYPFSSYSSNALIMVGGNRDSVTYALLPQFSVSLSQLVLVLTHIHESVSLGTLTVGYIDGSVFVPLNDLVAVRGEGRCDTISFAAAPPTATNMAFRWRCDVSWTVLIDDVEVRLPTPPRVQIYGPMAVDAFDTVTYNAQLIEGDTLGLTYSWYSSISGQWTSGSQLSVVYQTPCVDTLMLVAVNNYGADTSVLLVNVQWPDGWVHTLFVVSSDSVQGLVAFEDHVAPMVSLAVNHGDMVTFRAVAMDGYHFTRWNDSVEDFVRTLAVFGDTQFVAYFEVDTVLQPDTVWRMVTVHSNDSTEGSVSGGGLYMDSTTVTICATAMQGYKFVAWNDGDTLNVRQIFVVSDTDFTAFFCEVEDSVGIADVRAGEWRLYPNPASTSVIVKVNQPTVMTMLDVSGREVLTKKLYAGGTEIDISHMPQGVYFLRLDGSTVVKKLIVR